MRTRDSRLLHLTRAGSLPVFLVLVLGFLVLGVANTGTGARWISPARPDLPLPDVQVRDEADRRVSLADAVRSTGPGAVLIAPSYARCRSSCPELARTLERALSGLGPTERPRVVFFLFDPSETADDVREFRARHGVPMSWRLLRSADPRATRAFFDAYAITAMTSAGGYAHPSEILVLDEQLRWSGSLTNTALRASTIRDALERTRFPHWRAVLSRPGSWLVIAIAGLSASFVLIVLMLRRMWRAGRTDPQPQGARP